MALEDNEAMYRAIFHSDPLPMWIGDGEKPVLLAVNDAALALYGFSREEFLNLKPGSFAADAARKSREGALVELSEQEIRFAGRRARLFRARLATAGAAGGNPQQVAALERLLAEKTTHLESARKELEAFSYSISHDLRAPLRHIDGFAKALLDDYGATLDLHAREYLDRIGRAAQKMSQLIDDLQKLGRVTRCEIQRQQVNLSVTAQVIALELKHGAPQRKVEFVIEPAVSGDADPRLIRVLMENLMANAWKFTSKNPTARIEFASELVNGERVYLVRDDGVGFDMEYADKLFSVFHRLHRADEFEGAGVGLAIAKRIVERHGGRIWAKSEAGRGATFYFTL